MHTSMPWQVAQWRGEAGCRWGMHQVPGHPSGRLSPAVRAMLGDGAAVSADAWSYALQGCLPKLLGASRGICHRGTVLHPCCRLDTHSPPETPPVCSEGERSTEQGTALWQSPVSPASSLG